MKKVYKNRLPKNTEVSNIDTEVVNGEVVVKIELEEKFNPKDGDFLVSSDGNVFIYTGLSTPISYGAYCGVNSNDDIDICHPLSSGWTPREGCRFATPREKSTFLKRLESEKYFRWDSKSKELVTTRWRAYDGESYYYIDSGGNVRMGTEWHTSDDNKRYEAGNYCRFEDELVPYAKQVKEIYKKLT